MDYETISVLVPTYNRSKFLPLFLLNLKKQDYPHDKLHIIIDDDGDEPFINDFDRVRQVLHPMKVIYLRNRERRTIGRKRNNLIKTCKTKIFAFMDDDDIYHSTYLTHSYETLKNKKVGCVGSDKMLFCMTDKDYSVHAIDCGNNVRMIHEATIMATKKWYKASNKFNNHNTGEGKQLFDGFENDVAITNIMKCMLCVQHGDNTVDKLQFAKDENKLDIEITDDFKDILNDILKK